MKKNDHMPADSTSSRSSLGMVIIVVLSIFCFMSLYSHGQAEAAVAALNAWPATPQLNGTTGNLSGTFTISSGSNRLLLVAVDCQDTGGSSGQTFSATYGGIALTQAVTENSNRRQTWIGYLNEAGIAGRSGDTLSVTITGTHTNVSAHIASYQGVDQTAPVTGSSGFYLNNANPGTFPAAVSINAGGYGIYTFSSNQTRSSDSETYTEHSDYLNGLRMGIASKAFASAGTTRPSVTYAAAARASHSLVTLNPAPAGTPGNLQFSAIDYSVNEDVGNVTITVTRTGGSSGSASVSYATSNGTAVQPGDYTSASGTLNWSDGDAADKTFTVAIINDLTVESSETVNLTLSGASGATMGTPSTATITITDNDVAGSPGITINPTSGLTTTEAGGTAQFTIVLDSAPTNNVTINLSSTITSEGTVAPTSVTFTTGNWSTAQTVTVTGVDDAVVDGNIAYTIVTAAATSTDGNYNGLNASDVAVTNMDNDGVPPPVPVGNWPLFIIVVAGMISYSMVWRKRQDKKIS